jgi:hypothetical protein
MKRRKKMTICERCGTRKQTTTRQDNGQYTCPAGCATYTLNGATGDALETATAICGHHIDETQIVVCADEESAEDLLNLLETQFDNRFDEDECEDRPNQIHSRFQDIDTDAQVSVIVEW